MPLVAGCSGRPGSSDGSVTDSAVKHTEDSTTETSPTIGNRPVGRSGERADFCWLERPVWEHHGIRDSLLAFAGRHDLAALFAYPDATGKDVAADLAAPLDAATERGVEAWLNVGVLTDLTPEEFVTDSEKRERHLAGLRAAARAYRRRFPTGRIVLWQEAPVGGTWVPGGAWNDAAVANLERHGSEIFAAQKRAIAGVAPDVDAGIFVHFPYIIESRRPETFETVISGLRDRGATPEFAFVDFYRGWYEKDVGPEKANAAIRSLIANARAGVGEVLYLGQSHTINPHHTPSKGAIRMDLRASGAADGRGWYARTAYTETERGFDPFVPNRDVAIARDGRANTVTVARDRYLYAYASLLAARQDFDSEDRFDCWVHTRNVGFHDRRLSLRTAEDDWEPVGRLGGYVPSVPYSSAEHVLVFRALDRDRFLDGGTLAGRIEPIADGGSAADARADSTTRPELVSVSAVPFDVGAFVPEYEAKVLLNDSGFGAVCLGRVAMDITLRPEGSAGFRVPIDRPDARGLYSLLYSDHQAQRRRLAAFESRNGFDLSETFDCWVLLDEPVEKPADALFVQNGGSRGDRRGGNYARTPLADASVARSVSPTCVVLYGLDRDSLLPRSADESLIVGVDREDTTVERAYAMPYFGSDNLVTAARARSLIAADPEEVANFGVARTRPFA